MQKGWGGGAGGEDGWVGGWAAVEAAVRAQLAAGKVPSLKPFQALAYRLPARLYLAVAAAHAGDEARKAGLLRGLAGPLPHPQLGMDQRLVVGYMSTDLGVCVCVCVRVGVCENVHPYSCGGVHVVGWARVCECSSARWSL